ncbi:embryo sac development arrest 7 [Artemisia annua]|uniref:Embryo sac development arrest 7 n=1 Tax=Artemisia annua TaxID=35608 RepID=A0A2U1MWG4_ARTAN|nr:embryo sac development arrest 7 [Artemisia annua]
MALDADKWDWKAAKVPNPLTNGIGESQQAKQDVLDGIDFARGDPKSTWRSVQAWTWDTQNHLGWRRIGWLFFKYHTLFVPVNPIEDFEVFENSLEYRALHPLTAPAQQSLVKEHFEPIEEDGDQSISDAEDDQSSDDEPANGKRKDGKKSRAPRGGNLKLYWKTIALKVR